MTPKPGMKCATEGCGHRYSHHGERGCSMCRCKGFVLPPAVRASRMLVSPPGGVPAAELYRIASGTDLLAAVRDVIDLYRPMREYPNADWPGTTLLKPALDRLDDALKRYDDRRRGLG